MELTMPGLFPSMLWVWILGASMFGVWLLFDENRETPVSDDNQFLIGLAILVVLTVSKAGHYGLTIQPEQWRVVDEVVTELPEEEPKRLSGCDLQF
jgi:hypothetical protein